MTEHIQDKDFIEYVVKALVDHPEDVRVERKIDEMGVLITLDVNAEDMGMVIGREGANAKALRTLLRVIGARNNARVNLKINEPEGSTRAQRPQDAPKSGEKKSLDEVVDDIHV
ncbi:MAG: KH domain-containing protein [Candidatus Moranbacteria bacterium]|nr:KH domain-containing protein [Candidatus Moranbacteria bacterium]